VHDTREAERCVGGRHTRGHVGDEVDGRRPDSAKTARAETLRRFDDRSCRRDRQDVRAPASRRSASRAWKIGRRPVTPVELRKLLPIDSCDPDPDRQVASVAERPGVAVGRDVPVFTATVKREIEVAVQGRKVLRGSGSMRMSVIQNAVTLATKRRRTPLDFPFQHRRLEGDAAPPPGEYIELRRDEISSRTFGRRPR